ncbi:MAG: 50S ribosomal protein L29 [Patescibacteria group bacterium]
MKIAELRQKSKEELAALLVEKREYADSLRISIRRKKVKNVKELGAVRKDIARILTVMS